MRGWVLRLAFRVTAGGANYCTRNAKERKRTERTGETCDKKRKRRRGSRAWWLNWVDDAHRAFDDLPPSGDDRLCLLATKTSSAVLPRARREHGGDAIHHSTPAWAQPVAGALGAGSGSIRRRRREGGDLGLFAFALIVRVGRGQMP